MDLGLQGARAIVTGGSKGIGFAVADQLLDEGCKVAICARDETALTNAASTLLSRRHDSTLFATACDVTDPLALEAFLIKATSRLGGLDILVNNAGGATPGNFEALTDEQWYADAELKLMSQIRAVRAALPFLRQSDRPRIINVNAIYGHSPDPNFLASSVNRASCLAFSKALADELGPEGILVNSVNIGFVSTPQWERIASKRGDGQSPEALTDSLAKEWIPLGRFGRPEEVATLIAFLASRCASYISGASIDVGGGFGSRG
ncbi:MAG: SDR family oxidoreductase [Acidimicrobiales bacterium]